MVAAIVVAIGLLAVWFLYLAPPPSPAGVDVVKYCGGEGSAQHYHPLLVVFVNGVQTPLSYDSTQSASIGYIHSPAFTSAALYCSGGGIHALHTHDGSGIIHVELPPGVIGTPTLGQFFEIWGQPIDPTHAWSYTGSVKLTVQDLHAGSSQDFSSSPGSVPLYPPGTGATTNPYPIPQSLIFNGANGYGSTGSGFSGEIIWLNITAPAG